MALEIDKLAWTAEIHQPPIHSPCAYHACQDLKEGNQQGTESRPRVSTGGTQ